MPSAGTVQACDVMVFLGQNRICRLCKDQVLKNRITILKFQKANKANLLSCASTSRNRKKEVKVQYALSLCTSKNLKVILCGMLIDLVCGHTCILQI